MERVIVTKCKRNNTSLFFFNYFNYFSQREGEESFMFFYPSSACGKAKENSKKEKEGDSILPRHRSSFW